MEHRFFLFSLGLLSCLSAGCGDDDGACGEPAYEGEATDEAWRTMVDGYADATAGADAPAITTPADDADVPADGEGLDVAWDSTISLAPSIPRAPRRAAPAPGLLDRAGALFEGTAWAHEPPITGDVYFVRITVPGAACPVEVLTTNLSCSIDGAGWDEIRAATGPVTIDVTSAYLTENRITEGPFRASTPTTVTIAP